MKLLRNILIFALFLWFYWLFIKSYFFDRFLFESMIYIFGLYISGHLFFIFYKTDKYFIIWLLLMSVIVTLLSQSFDYSSILQILLFHAAIWWMSWDMDFVINGRINVNRRSLMMYSSITFIMLISIIYAIRIWTVQSNFSCEILRNQTNEIINEITLAYPRNKANERFNNSSLNNIINGKMSNILWIWFDKSGDIYKSNDMNRISIDNWINWINISELNTRPIEWSKTSNELKKVKDKEINKQSNILQNLSLNNNELWSDKDSWNISDNLTHNTADINKWYNWNMTNDIIWKLEYIKNIIINNIINDKSIADKWICEYIYEQVKLRQDHPEFLISSIVLLFAILYPFFRFLFYIVWFVWRLILLILSKIWLYKISIYYEKVEKLE